jgi:hypothetical protein
MSQVGRGDATDWEADAGFGRRRSPTPLSDLRGSVMRILFGRSSLLVGGSLLVRVLALVVSASSVRDGVGS